MSHVTVKMGERGRLVIPADLRERLGLRAGDRLVLSDEGGELRLAPLSARIEALRGRWSDLASGRDFAGELIDERRAESARE